MPSLKLIGFSVGAVAILTASVVGGMVNSRDAGTGFYAVYAHACTSATGSGPLTPPTTPPNPGTPKPPVGEGDCEV